MAEAVASQIHFRAPSLAGPSVSNEALRQQVEDFELLIETMLEKYEQAEAENRTLKEQNKALREEVERLRPKK